MLGTYGANETFFTLKGELEAIFSGLRISKARYEADRTNPSYHPGRCARVSIDGTDVGFIGQIHPLVAQNYGIDSEVYCAEINFTKLFALQLPEATYVPLPKYPTVSRDLSIVCDEATTVADVEDVITAAIVSVKEGLIRAVELKQDEITLDTESLTPLYVRKSQAEEGR
jgi:phenylalanyl-tRNA synthetase beta chain